MGNNRCNMSPHNELEDVKERARRMVQGRVKSGVLVRKPCEAIGCGTTKNIHAHHPDYSEPLNVIWLCRFHHLEVHKYLWKKAPPRVHRKFYTCEGLWCRATTRVTYPCTCDGAYSSPLYVCQRCHRIIHKELEALTRMRNKALV